MPLDAGDERWLRERLDRLDADADHLFLTAQKITLRLERLSGDDKQLSDRIAAAESRNARLWALVTTLGLTLLGGSFVYVQRIASLEAELKGVKEAARKDAEDARADIKELAKQLREHEVRASVPRPEPVK